MLLKPNQQTAFLKSLNADIAVALFFGEDEGKSRLLIDQLIEATGTSKTDPFSFVDIAEDALKADPAILSDEFSAIGFGTARRILRLRITADRGLKPLTDFLQNVAADPSPPGSLLIIHSGALTPKSPLRKLAETAANMIAIACEPDRAQSLRTRIENRMRDNGLHFGPGALDTMLEFCGEDTAMTGQEIEKILLFKKDSEPEITEAEILEIVDGGKSLLPSEIAKAIIAGDMARLDSCVSKAVAENETPVAIVRTLMWQLDRQQSYGSPSGGRKITPQKMLHMKRKLFWAEKHLKQTGTPQWPFCRNVLTTLARM